MVFTDLLAELFLIRAVNLTIFATVLHSEAKIKYLLATMLLTN